MSFKVENLSNILNGIEGKHFGRLRQELAKVGGSLYDLPEHCEIAYRFRAARFQRPMTNPQSVIYPAINPLEEVIGNKKKQFQYLRDLKIRVPDWLDNPSREQAVETLGESYVMKPEVGSMGKGVIYVDSEAKHNYAVSIGSTVATKLVKTDGYTRRVVYVDGEVVSVLGLTSDDVISNVARGGRPSPAQLLKSEREETEGWVQLLGLDTAAIDVARDENGVHFLDVHITIAPLDTERVTGINVYGALANHMARKLQA